MYLHPWTNDIIQYEVYETIPVYLQNSEELFRTTRPSGLPNVGDTEPPDPLGYLILAIRDHQDQDQDSLLVKRRNDIHAPGAMAYFIWAIWDHQVLWITLYTQ